MSFSLRDYQVVCADSIFEQWRTHQSTLLSLFTGGGKTIIFAEVIRRTRPGRAIVLANREELIFQACDKIQRTTGLHCEIEMADMVASASLFTSADVIVSTVQTQVSGKTAKRMTRFNPEDFSLLVVDEAHFSTSPSFREVIEYYSRNPNLKVLGVTATPSRHDKQALGQIYKSVAANYGMADGIQLGWLCELTQQFVPVAGLDYSHIKTYKGDLSLPELQAEMERQENIVGVCQPSIEVMFALPPKTLSDVPVPEWGNYLKSLNRQARRAIVFTASVAQANLCAEIFNRVWPSLAESVDGKTPKEKRRDLLKRFTAGDVRAIMNCGVLTHGFDEPQVECIIMARATKSKSLYEQMVGRSTRPLPGVVDGENLDTPEKRRAAIAASAKPYCRIIDFVGNSGNHKIVTCADVLGGKYSSDAVIRAVKKAQADGKPVKIERLLDQVELDLEKEKQARIEARRREEASKRNHLVAKVDFVLLETHPFEACGMTRATKYSHSFGVPPTPNQSAFLAKRGINCEQLHMTRGEAGTMIGKLKAADGNLPATEPQKKFLRWKGLDGSRMTKREAHEAIEKIKNPPHQESVSESPNESHQPEPEEAFA